MDSHFYRWTLMVSVLVIAVTSCQPLQEVGVLPTLAVIPSITPSRTPEATSRPTHTTTLELPTATITETVPASFTPKPTFTPTPVCNAWAWDQEINQMWVATLINDAAGYQTLYDRVAAVEFAPCISEARSYFLNFLNENILFHEARDRLDVESSDTHMQQSQFYFERYMEVVQQVWQEDPTFTPSITAANNGESFSCPSDCDGARSMGLSDSQAAACGLDGDNDGVACHGD
jgi:hypothetical protein